MQIIISRKSPNDLQQQRLPQQAPISISGERGGWEFPSRRWSWVRSTGTSRRKVPPGGHFARKTLYLANAYSNLDLAAVSRGSAHRVFLLGILAPVGPRLLLAVFSNASPLLSALCCPLPCPGHLPALASTDDSRYVQMRSLFQLFTSAAMLLPKTQ